VLREAVLELSELGPLPSEQTSDGRLVHYEKLLASISAPLNDEEVKVLVGLFGSDEGFGLNWSLLHLIESAPNWPIDECLSGEGNEWIDRLRSRVENARTHGQSH
jgi:hypothetical protein